MTRGWVYALIAIVIGHAIATVGLYVWLNGGGTPGANRTERRDDTRATSAQHEDRENVVVCSSCGTQNEPGYRYCRECVSPIGSGPDQRGGTDGPDSPWIR